VPKFDSEDDSTRKMVFLCRPRHLVDPSKNFADKNIQILNLLDNILYWQNMHSGVCPIESLRGDITLVLLLVCCHIYSFPPGIHFLHTNFEKISFSAVLII